MEEKALQKTEIMSLDVNPEALIAQAIARGNDIPIDTMEKLLAMRRELKAEWAQEEYFKALANFQQACPEIKKTKIVYNKNSTTVRYHYAPLEDIVEQCKDLLKENGFSYIIKTEQTEKSVKTINEMHHIAGHTEESSLTIPIDSADYLHMNAAQQVASARTYGKRYTFCDGFGILTGDEDDDAQSTEDKKEAESTAEKTENNKKIWPNSWQPILQEINDMLVEKPFDKTDRKSVYQQCLDCKSLADICFIRDEWKKKSDKRIAEQEALDETAGKAFIEKQVNEIKTGPNDGEKE